MFQDLVSRWSWGFCFPGSNAQCVVRRLLENVRFRTVWSVNQSGEVSYWFKVALLFKLFT